MTTIQPAAGVALAAQRLIAAQKSLRPCLPVRDLIGDADAEAAYAVQKVVTARRIEEGAAVVGRKIGLTSEVVQRQFGIDQPDFGVLFDDMRVADGAPIPRHRLLQPKVEAEIAFILKDDLAEVDLGLDQVRAAVGYVAGAIEIVDSRIDSWDIRFGDTVADNASSGMYVLGGWWLPLEALTPAAVEMSMELDGVIVSTGSGAACLGDPLLALQWLARTASRLGDPLRAGQVVLSGALGPMVGLPPGSVATATMGILGTVTANYTMHPVGDCG